MIGLATLVRDFARGVKAADARGPQAISRSDRVYRPGLGPHTESQSVRLILDELTALDPTIRLTRKAFRTGPARGSDATCAWGRRRLGTGQWRSSCCACSVTTAV
jgi:hypothetical protein